MTGGEPLRGAYGLALEAGLGAGHASLPVAAEDWPRWRIDWDDADPAGVADEPPDVTTLDTLGGGRLVLDQGARRVRIRQAEAPSVAALLHPWLSTIGALAAHGRRRDTFHGGGVVVDGRVWALLGTKEGGKSTALAWFAARGEVVTSDDLVVLDGDLSLAGPGCVDLREGAARHLAVGEEETLLPGRRRWRVWLPAPPASLPLAGFVIPEWGTDLDVSPITGAERLTTLVERRSVLAPRGQDRRMVELCGWPMLRWRRPQDFAALDRAGSALLDALRR